MWAPRATARSHSSRTSAPAPSVITNPSRLMSNGREFPEVDEFQTVITHEGIRDEITLRVEMKPDWPVSSWGSLSETLRKRLAQAHEGLNFRVEQAAAGELPRFELKAKRTVDLGGAPAPAVLAP